MALSLNSLYKFVLCIALIAQVCCICDRTFDSSTINTYESKFEGPRQIVSRRFKISALSNSSSAVLTNKTQNDYQQMHCVYKFIAKPDERVMVNFTSFKLRGSEPLCDKEYLEVFFQVTQDQLTKALSDDMTALIEHSPVSGRYCASIAPRNIVSLHNIIVLNFHSTLPLEGNKSNVGPLFSGTFEFVAKTEHLDIGKPLDGTECSHIIRSYYTREGRFKSNTYPGSYVKGLKCSYKFIGKPEQRIRLEFRDLDLYSGGSHCPVDVIKVYDGLEESDALINTICGSHRSYVIFSSGPNLLIKFHTFEQEANVANRGFSANFEFTDRFVSLKFIQADSAARHIRGSECDQRIVSHRIAGGRTNGTIISPLTPHRATAMCRYIFEGLQNSLDYEKVSLRFVEFDLKTPKQLIGAVPETSSQHQDSAAAVATTALPASIAELTVASSPQTSSSSSSASSNASNLEQCPDNYLRLYTGGLKLDQRQDPNDYDYMYCNDELPQPLESDAASLLMEYNSGQTGGFFKADYSFIVDYRIPGTQPTQACDFVYKSDTQKQGAFNSPWHPSWYMNDVNCTYTFVTKEGEALLLQFNAFKMFNETISDSVGGYNELCRLEDRVEIFEITFLDSSEQRVSEQREVGTYCATSAPGPILSYKSMRIIFRSNAQKVAYGFSGVYNFYPISRLSSNEFVTNCGGQIVSSARYKTGTIASPATYKPELYEKRHHICTWDITVRPTFRVLLTIDMFEIEGTQKARGCNKAILRLNFDNSTKPPLEFCGSKTGDTMIASSYLSDGERATITFISTKQASGSFGFKASWAEVKKIS